MCSSQCLLSGIALNHPQQPWQMGLGGLLEEEKKTPNLNNPGGKYPFILLTVLIDLQVFKHLREGNPFSKLYLMLTKQNLSRIHTPQYGGGLTLSVNVCSAPGRWNGRNGYHRNHLSEQKLLTFSFTMTAQPKHTQTLDIRGVHIMIKKGEQCVYFMQSSQN